MRFYIRKGLLKADKSSKGGRNPYQIFTAEHVEAAKIIRIAQSVGLSLNDLASIRQRRRTGRYTSEFKIEILSTQLSKLEIKAAEINAMTRYLRAKIEWVKKHEKGSPPDFDEYAKKIPNKRSNAVATPKSLGD